MCERPVAESVSRDTLFSGKLHCVQYQNGYRFSVDAVLLAHFMSPKSNERILDLGSGCGIISLLLAYRWPQTKIVSLELQATLLSLLNKNIQLNNFQQRIEVVSGDFCEIRQFVKAGSFDMLVCNPPYYKRGSGRLNPASEQAVARHEIKSNLTDAVQAASYALKNKGRAAFVYPSSRGASLIGELKRFDLEPKRLQAVYSYPGTSAKLLLVEAVKNGGEELEVLAPFFIYTEAGGEYSMEMASYYMQ